MQQRYSSSMKKISKLEKQLKEARQENELLMEQLGQHGGTKSAGSNLSKDQQSQQSEQQVTESLVFELTEKEEEIRILREKCDNRYKRIKTLEKQNANLDEQAKGFEVDYHVEVEENQVLKTEIEKLRHQLEALSSVDYTEDTNSDEETITNYKKAYTALKKQVHDLSNDIAKLRDHSKEQSRQILKLRQQTEMTEVCYKDYSALDTVLLLVCVDDGRTNRVGGKNKA